MKTTNELMLYLIGCSLHGCIPEEGMMENADLNALFHLAKTHSIVNLVGCAIERSVAFQAVDPELKKKWREAKEKAIRKNLLLDAERRALFSEFEKQGIWYMPLKGVILKDYYPKYGMREMADNDILFDMAKRERVKEIFSSKGYDVIVYGRSNHDVYEKAPVLNYEMHTELFGAGVYPDLARKYADVKSRLIKDDGNSFGYHFSNEDYYVYVMAHAYKHYSHSGTGVRTLVDFFVMNQKLGSILDWDYVNRELDSLGILEYEKAGKILAEKLFVQPTRVTDLPLSEDEEKMLSYYLGSTTYGTMDNMVNNSLQELNEGKTHISVASKVRYTLQRLFPSREWCRMPYPTIYKYPVLLPFFWVWRIVNRFCKNGASMKKELRAVRKAK